MIKHSLSFFVLALGTLLIGCSSGNRAPATPGYVGKWAVSPETVDKLIAEMTAGAGDAAANELAAGMIKIMADQMKEMFGSMVMDIGADSMTGYSLEGKEEMPFAATKIDDTTYRFDATDEEGKARQITVNIIDADRVDIERAMGGKSMTLNLIRLDDAEFERRAAAVVKKK